MKKTILIVFTCLVHLAVQSEPAIEKRYVGVATEYESADDTNTNINDYGYLISTASALFSGDIVVFPESCLTTRLEDACMVPGPGEKVIPHQNNTYNAYKVMQNISKAADENDIYVVVNLYERVNCSKEDGDCPSRGYYVYNTNVAFDRNGTVVARYRKFNVYDEGKVDKPKQVELSTFTTDFGVTYGMFTCFDILFKSPAVDLVKVKNVKNIVFPSRWYGELPFLTSVQVQSGWSYTMNVTMLAAGASRVESGSTGTGIYTGRDTKINWMGEKTGTHMIFRGMSVSEERKSDTNGLKLLEDPSVTSAKWKELDLNSGGLSDEICHNGFCCKFDIRYRKSNSFNPQDKYSYRAVVFQGERRFGKNFTHDVAYGAVVLCIDGNCAKKPKNGNYPLIFDQIKIVGQFKKENTLQFPNTLVWKGKGEVMMDTMEYEQFSYETAAIVGTDKNNVSMKLAKEDVGNLMTFGIYSRKFD